MAGSHPADPAAVTVPYRQQNQSGLNTILTHAMGQKKHFNNFNMRVTNLKQAQPKKQIPGRVWASH